MDGSVWLGPNAILAFAREGYNFTDFNAKDFREALSFPGLQKLVLKYWQFGSMELFRRVFLVAQWRQLRKYVPEIQPEDIVRYACSIAATPHAATPTSCSHTHFMQATYIIMIISPHSEVPLVLGPRLWMLMVI